MNATKWVQIVCSFILVLLPAAIHYRNWKHSDRRTTLHRWITKALLTLWIVAGLGLAWATWKDLSRRQKEPLLTIFVNGFRVGGKTNLLTFPLTNDSPELRFDILNEGDWQAEGLIVQASISGALTVSKSDGWNNGRRVKPIGGALAVGVDHMLWVQTDIILNTSTMFGCPPVSVQSTNLAREVNQLMLTVTAKNSRAVETWVWIRFKEGITNAYVGF